MSIPTRIQIEAIALAAGRLIMSMRGDGKTGKVTAKSDGSPVSAADQAADFLIKKELQKLSFFPIVSEEDEAPKNLQADASLGSDFFWLVDPLDGTRDFLAGLPYFTVNIALIYRNYPVMGVICAPALDELFTAYEGVLYKNGQVIDCRPDAKVFPQKAVVSHFHGDLQTTNTLKMLGIKDIHSVGSSFKFAMLADGKADIYLRYGPCHSWDIAAGQAIAESAGFNVYSMKTLDRMAYVSPQNLVEGFWVCANEQLQAKFLDLP